jgi:hypothetical protein
MISQSRPFQRITLLIKAQSKKNKLNTTNCAVEHHILCGGKACR